MSTGVAPPPMDEEETVFVVVVVVIVFDPDELYIRRLFFVALTRCILRSPSHTRLFSLEQTTIHDDLLIQSLLLVKEHLEFDDE